MTLVVGALTAPAAVIDFDSIAASCCFGDVTAGGARGPQIVFGNATVDGGVVLDDTAFADTATSNPNIYATFDLGTLGDGSTLPGFITISFLNPVSFVSLDVINGFGAADFTLAAYDASSVLLGSSIVSLSDFGAPGSVGNTSVSFAGIRSVVISTNQGVGNTDFAIDTVNYTESAVPEPRTWLSMAGGLAAIALRRARRARS